MAVGLGLLRWGRDDDGAAHLATSDIAADITFYNGAESLNERIVMQRKMMGLTGVLCLFLVACQPEIDYATDGPIVSEQDFSVLVGDWEGTLTYTDYGSGERTVIASTASVAPTSKTKIDYSISYPDEPWEDSTSTLTISEDGRLLDGHVISDRMAGED